MALEPRTFRNQSMKHGRSDLLLMGGPLLAADGVIQRLHHRDLGSNRERYYCLHHVRRPLF
jgi:hypothetical protein